MGDGVVDNSPVKDLFIEALDLPAQQRIPFLERRCGGNDQVREEVQALLDAHASAVGFLGDGEADAAATDTPSAAHTTELGNVGPYKLLHVIGEGGFGTVYLAEQQHPVRRRVALKVIKLGMDTKQVIARFEAERQALAMMDHPNIARVYDAGATEAGRPYFVMELVSGVPVTRYCDANRLTMRQRLELFIPICQAVQHAHQKGIIHRDLKPSNVLVTLHDGQPVPKIIDFGIAKATQARLTERTLFTDLKQMIGTPEYMSPEQAEMGALDIDTRTDVYSLGVLLYELLTGSTPFDARELRSKAFGEMQRLIREVDPPRPSTRVSTVGIDAATASQRATELRKLSAMLRGELDWIVMKCLEKERTRRYESAGALSADLQRYLHDEPVQAAPESTAYRMRKFVRRHKGPVAASAAVILVLVAGVIGTTIGLMGQERQRRLAEQQRAAAQKNADEARRQASIAEAVSRFQTEMLASADPFNQMGEKLTVLQAVQAAEKELDAGKLSDQPLVEAAVRHAIGVTLMGLGRYLEAEAQMRKALALRRTLLPADDAAIATSLNDLGGLIAGSESEKLLREALQIRRRVLPPEHPLLADTLNALGYMLVNQHRINEAEPLFRESLAINRASLPPDHLGTSAVVMNLGRVVQEQGKLEEAEALMREGFEMRRRGLPAGHPAIANGLRALAMLYERMGRLPESERLMRESIDIYRAKLPPDSPELTRSYLRLATYLQAQRKLEEAESLIRQTVEIQQAAMSKVPPEGPPGVERIYPYADYGVSLNALGLLLRDKGKLRDAEATLREAIAVHRQRTDNTDAALGIALSNLAVTLALEEELEEAEAMSRQALELCRRAHPAGHIAIARGERDRAMVLQRRGRVPESEDLFRQAITHYERVVGRDNWELATVRLNLGTLLGDQKRHAEAEPLLLEAERVSRSAGYPSSTRRDVLTHLVALYDDWETHAPGTGCARKAAEWRAKLPATAPTTAPATAPTTSPSR